MTVLGPPHPSLSRRPTPTRSSRCLLTHPPICLPNCPRTPLSGRPWPRPRRRHASWPPCMGVANSPPGTWPAHGAWPTMAASPCCACWSGWAWSRTVTWPRPAVRSWTCPWQTRRNSPRSPSRRTASACASSRTPGCSRSPRTRSTCGSPSRMPPTPTSSPRSLWRRANVWRGSSACPPRSSWPWRGSMISRPSQTPMPSPTSATSTKRTSSTSRTWPARPPSSAWSIT